VKKLSFILFITMVLTLPSVDLSIREGSVFLRPEPGQSFLRVVESMPLPIRAEWQTSADFYGGLISNQGFYPLGPASHFVVRSGALYRRENTEFRHILDLGMESESSQPGDDADMILNASPSVLLSRKRTFENREVAGKIRLSHQDHIRSPSRGIQTIQIADISIFVFPSSELVIQSSRVVLIHGAIQILAKTANSRFEVLVNNTLITLLGTRAQIEHGPEEKTTKAIAISGILRVEDRNQNSTQKTELLRPGEILLSQGGKFKKPSAIPSHLNTSDLADSWLNSHRLPPEPETPILEPVSKIRTAAENLTQRAKRYREEQMNPEEFLESSLDSQSQTPSKSRPFDWLSQEEQARNQLPQGLNRQAAQQFPPHPRGLAYSGFHATDNETRNRNHELGEANRALDERVRIQKESLRLGIDPQAIRQGTRLSDSQLSQTQQFLVQREREASRLSAEINRHEREREQLERKLELVERRGGDNLTLLRLRQDKQELQLRSEELRNSQRRLQELIREANQQLLQSRIQSDLGIQREDTLLKKMRNRLR